MSWYRTYRPQTIASLHLPEVRQSLDRIRTSGTFSHAYLFTGPKGTGKTSSARIFAKMLNCEKNAELVKKALSKTPIKDPPAFQEPCGVCPACMSITNGSSLCVVEMDAASNRGIDDIRLLRERINLAPNDGLVSVYIIDEVHMLTTEAFNALLKVLEEPPRHVVFVLATTELHKVPDTIISRCTVVKYRKATDRDLESALTSVAREEEITVEDGVLSELAKRADGSFRDAIKLFEQLVAGSNALTKIDLERLGDSNVSQLAIELIEALLFKQTQKVSSLFTQAEHNQTDIAYLHKKVLEMCRARLSNAVQVKNTREMYDMQKLLEALNVPLDPLLPIPTLPFELSAMAWCLEEEQEINAPAHVLQPTMHVHNDVLPIKTSQKNEEKIEEKRVPISIKSPALSKKSHEALSVEHLTQGWGQVLQFIKGTNTTVEALLRAGRPISYDGSVCTIEIFYPFHKEQLEQEKYCRAVEKALGEGYGITTPRVVFVLGDKSKRPQRSRQSDDLVKTAAEALM